MEVPQRERVKFIEKKLDACRNQENNPDSAMWVYIQGVDLVDGLIAQWTILIYLFSSFQIQATYAENAWWRRRSWTRYSQFLRFECHWWYVHVEYFFLNRSINYRRKYFWQNFVHSAFVNKSKCVIFDFVHIIKNLSLNKELEIIC